MEENPEFDKMRSPIINKYGVRTISTTINGNLWLKAREKHISWAEALRVGITHILSQEGEEEYINPMQQNDKIAKLIAKIEELATQNLEYQEKLRLIK